MGKIDEIRKRNDEHWESFRELCKNTTAATPQVYYDVDDLLGAVDQLEAENERYQKALQKIGGEAFGGFTYGDAYDMRAIARKALGGES